MTRLSGLLDPESAAVVVAAYDGATSPRRGGPRFVDPRDVDRAERLAHDDRSTEQIALDSFVELVRIGAGSAPDVVGAQPPAVRIVVTDHDLARRAGHGWIEGQTTPLSIATVGSRRFQCVVARRFVTSATHVASNPRAARSSAE